MRTTLIGVATLAAVAVLGVASVGRDNSPAAGAAPKLCGGQNADWAAPFQCYGEKVIDGVLVHVEVSVDYIGNASIVYSLPNGPIGQPATLQVYAHPGTSDSPGTAALGAGLLPKGETSFPLAVTFPNICLDQNQLDVKFWAGLHRPDVHWPADKRVTGPTFKFPQGCVVASTTTTSAPTTTVPVTTVPGQTTTTTTPTTVASAVLGAQEIPATK